VIGSRQLNEILKRLKADDPRARDVAAAELGDLIAGDQLSEKAYIQMATVLVPIALAETDPQARESMFHALSEVTRTTPVEAVEWEPLAMRLDLLPSDCLEYSLYLLGSSRNPKYIARLEPFLKHRDPEIRAAAAEALSELGWSKGSSVARAN
jgi:hypothetical protein